MTKLELINIIIESFDKQERGDGSTFYCLKYGTSEDIKDLIYKAHDGLMPNDWIYEKTLDIAYSIQETLEYSDDLEDMEIDAYIDIYTSDLLAWLSSNLYFLESCDDARVEFGADTMIGMMQGGQYSVLNSIKYELINFLETNTQDEDL